MMCVLIAGGAGFIGSHLCDALLKKGHSVIVADKLIFGGGAIGHLLQDDALISAGKFRFYQAELSDQEQVDRIFEENSIDAVYHLAANSDIQKGGKEPSVDFQDTLLTTRALLEGMCKTGVKRLFFSSTSAVYGDKPDERLTENTGGLAPISYYGGAKLASEALIQAYTAMNDLSTVIFRFPNVIGPRLTHGVIFDFIRKLREDPNELSILGDGKQCKPYIYVLDLVDAIVRLTDDWQPGADIFNLSVQSDGTTVTRIAEIVVEVMGLSNVTFRYTGGSRGWKGDVPRFQYDISKVLATGWKPEHTSDEAVRQTVLDALHGAE